MPDGFSLWESNSILRYLCRTRPGGNAFYPEAPEARADVERWMDWQLGSLGEPMRTIFWTFVRTPEAERDLRNGDGELYRSTPPDRRAVEVRAVPYYAWANRDPGEMLVWLREGPPARG